MAGVLCPTFEDYLRRPATYLNPQTNWTYRFVFYWAAAVTGERVLLLLGNAAYATPWLSVYGNVGNTVSFSANPGTGQVNSAASSAVLLNTWHQCYVEYVASSTTLTVRIDETITISASVNMSASATFPLELLGSDAGAGQTNQRVYGARVWQSALTIGERVLEDASPIAIKRTNLLAEQTLQTVAGLPDLSGNGNHFTVFGAPTTALIHEETWATTFTEVSEFQTTDYNGVDAPITGYPKLAGGENVKVATPGILEVIDLYEPGESSQTAGVAFVGIGPLTRLAGSWANGLWDGTRGCITFQVNFNSSYVSNNYCIVITLASKAGSTAVDAGLFSPTLRLYLAVYNDFYGPGRHALELNYATFDGVGIDFVNTYEFIGDDRLHEVTLEWLCCGSNAGFQDATDNTGFIKVTVDGKVVYSLKNLQLFVSTDFNKITGFWLGYAGMIGSYGAVSVSDVPCDPIVNSCTTDFDYEDPCSITTPELWTAMRVRDPNSGS